VAELPSLAPDERRFWRLALGPGQTRVAAEKQSRLEQERLYLPAELKRPLKSAQGRLGKFAESLWLVAAAGRWQARFEERRLEAEAPSQWKEVVQLREHAPNQ